MHLSLQRATFAGAVLWGGGILVSGLINLGAPHYAEAFLQVMSSLYPGFHDSHTIGDVIVGTLYGLVDGGIGGLLFAWLFNLSRASS